VDPMAVTAGYARFHSSFTEKVEAYARKHNLDVRDLIVRLCQEDQVSAPDELLERLSQELAAERMPRVTSIPVFGLSRPRPEGSLEALQAMLKQLRPHAVKAGKLAAINIAVSETPLPDFHVSANIQDTLAHIVAPINVSTEDQLAQVLQCIDGWVDVAFLDVDRHPSGPSDSAATARRLLKKTLLLTYSDGEVWITAAADQVVRLLGEAVAGVSIVIAGDHPRARRLALRLAQRGAGVTLLVEPGSSPRLDSTSVDRLVFSMAASAEVHSLPNDSTQAEILLASAPLVVVWPRSQPWFGSHHARLLNKGAYLVDAGVGSVLPEGLAAARRRGARPIRVNLWPALAGALAAAHESARVCRESLGWGTIAGVEVVSGGALGQAGTLVVDNVHQPRRVIGVADGCGRISFDYTAGDLRRVQAVSAEIQRKLLEPRLHS
jgi:hypothetical protein